MKTIYSTLFILTVIACNPKYNEIMQKKVVSALGSDFKKYEPFSYPTNNFGLITCYEKNADDYSFICDTWECIGKANSLPSNPVNLLDLEGFAAVGSNGATIALSEKEEKGLALKTVLPKLFNVVGISGSYDENKVKTVKLTIGPAFPRKLRRTRIVSLFKSLPRDNKLKQLFEKGDLNIVVADVVVTSMTVDITVDDQIKLALNGKLETGVPNFGDTELKVGLSKGVTGNYLFEISQPVILLRLTKRQNGANELNADDSFDTWTTVSIEDNLASSRK